MTRRETPAAGGIPISYIAAGEEGSLALLLHGTYWGRVWRPVPDGIVAAGVRAVVVDFPGFGRSGGELTVSEASVPRLSAWPAHFLDALGHGGPVMVAGHDIGGGHVRFVAGSWRSSLPGSGSGRRDDAGQHSGRAAYCPSRRRSGGAQPRPRSPNISIPGQTRGSLAPGWRTRLVRIKSASHFPMENNAEAVAGALSEFFAAERR